ncbi:hypothetical protein T265_03381 [Opisthorchis viverrini]|uniref:Apple domain-containing protein n=1 Tax=Opisthorchis viverrini TaxID=6198 RepID=A0A075A3I4_OPIVI|nr:hypothetical protein T265_03381 [Opisthorchis viverrini]KER30115.1 hypothetical protein T265_03381 [Opisthorchis viverrini]
MVHSTKTDYRDGGNCQASQCALNPHCRSVYFHKQDRRCILMLYADALLPAKLVRSRNRWTRFGKVANEEK